MSTRATYSIKNRYSDLEHVIYIHHDGYPEGAADYILKGIEYGRGMLSAESFLRGNERAELTKSHEYHADTEYRYYMDPEKNLMVAKERMSFGDNNWLSFYVGTISDFVSKYNEIEMRNIGGSVLMTKDSAKAYAELKRAQAEEYEARFPHYSGNIASMKADAERAEKALAEFK